MYAQYDAAPGYGAQNVLDSDDIVNSQRDGNNTRIVISLEQDITSGSFNVRITQRRRRPSSTDITITPAYTTGSPR